LLANATTAPWLMGLMSTATSSPFLEPEFHVRWSKHTAECIVPDISAALERAGVAVHALVGETARPTYANTFAALDGVTEELNFAWGKVTHLQSVADAPALRAAHNAMLPRVSAFFAKLRLDPALWARLRAAAESPGLIAALEPVQRRHVEETLADFREAGADLPPAQRARLEALEAELAEVTQKYGENVLDATNAWELIVTDEARLRGIPPAALATARALAADKGLGTDNAPAWRFTLQGPSQEPVMLHADDPGLRRELWTAAVAVGAQAPHDNGPLAQRILALRHEKATLLGHTHFADLVLRRRMAGTGARALAFVEDFERRARAAFQRECLDLETHKAAMTGQPAGRLLAWEVSYWAEKLRQARHAFDEEALRPYFEVGRVIAGLLALAQRVFGLRIAEAPENTVETWHQDTKFYVMRDARGRHLGSFYADWHPREAKRGGAWMGYLVTGGPRADAPGGHAPALGYICGNLTPPSPGRAALLTHREVETIFHEFGHLIHHLLGEVPVKSLNGVNVAWDFVELPSQIMENWCWERAGLDLFARHHETGAPIPEALFARMTAARRFRAACATMRQVQFAKMDLLMHMRAPEFATGDLEAGARALVADCLIPTEPPARTIVRRFGHLFSEPVGYAAGYYSYKWAEVLEADAFTRFQNEGVFNAAVGAQFVEHVLSRGNSAEPTELFRRFMGRDPDPGALLARSGLAAG
jgi:oligopeptidase A